MKHTHLLAIIISVLIFITACEPDNTTPISENGVESFIGTWQVQETSKLFGTSSYSVKIEENTANNTDIKISNFYNTGMDEVVNGMVSGDTIFIEQQLVNSGEDERKVWGKGYLISENQMSWRYYADDFIEIDTVTATYRK